MQYPEKGIEQLSGGKLERWLQQATRPRAQSQSTEKVCEKPHNLIVITCGIVNTSALAAVDKSLNTKIQATVY